ncbi:MAG TPA: hypothetical protein PLF13_11290 [candidate division Zixibacteria bacterium]|nr:hypothetical protein [candidate division Zixibacteria bacterium]
MARINLRHFRLSRLDWACLALLVVLLVFRLWNLDADPPGDLSGSSDVYTDPPQYTLFAKQYVQSGELNPFHDDRRVFFVKSVVTALAVVVFKIIGVGLWQSNFVGLLLSFGSLLLFFLFVRKISGSLAGLLFLLLVGLNYNQLFYGRLPFLEHAMSFFAILAAVLLVYRKSMLAHLLAGAALAVGIFFGKVVGTVFLFPFACLLFYQFWLDYRGETLKSRLVRPGAFVAGFAVVVVFWLFFSYIPAQSQVGGYIQEQAVELYGAPEGLQSFDDFVWKMVSFGVRSNLFPRMSTIALLGVIFLGMIFYHVGRKVSWREGFGRFNSGHLFMAAMIVAFFGSMAIWNYRPLRYELVLIFPFCGGAAVVLSTLWQTWSEPKAEKTPWLFYVLFYPAVMVTLSQTFSGLSRRLDYNFTFDENKYMLGVLSLILTVLTGVLVNIHKKGKIPYIPIIWRVVMVCIVVGVLIAGGSSYAAWWSNPTFTLRDNSHDIAMILPPDAVLSGPFAPQFSLSNDLGTVIHMFGVAQADSNLFKRFPVTHLLVDEANENRARDDYSHIMSGATHVVTYYVGKKRVRLYRIAYQTDNPQTTQYKRSAFERAVDLYNEGSLVLANRLLIDFIKGHPQNISGYLMMYEMAKAGGFYEDAEALLKKAIEFSPTNYNLNATLAVFYKERYEETADTRYKSLGLEYFEIAEKLAPTVKKVQEERLELEDVDLAP